MVAVMTKRLPLGRVLVCTAMLVCEGLFALVEALVEMAELGSEAEGETEAVAIVLAPPPAVVTKTTP